MSSRSALRNRRKRSPRTVHATERRLSHQTLERRELLAGDLGPQLISVSANSGENFRLTQQNILRESPNQLTFRFDGSQQIDAATLAAISIERAGGDGSFNEGNEIRIDPGFLGFGDSSRIVIARFGETLPDDTYRISIAGFDDTNEGIVGLRNSDGQLLRVAGATDPLRPQQQIEFRLELGPQVVAIVPQPITGTGASREQHRRQIQVFFNEDPLSNPAAGVITTDTSSASVVQPIYYNLFLTGDTVENTDDGPAINPSSVSYNPALNHAVLTFDSDLSDYVAGGAGTFRLRVGSSQALPGAPSTDTTDLSSNVGGLFTTAHNLGMTFNALPQSVVISGQIEPTANYPVIWPGAETAALGSRQREQQLIGQPDTTAGINTFYYNFAEIYGRDPAGNLLENAITDIQRQRVREALALYSQHLGVQFIETQDRGLQFVTGDLRALVVSAITGTGQALHEYRVDDTDPGRGVLILNAAETWFDGYGLSPDQANNPAYFTELLRGIGSLLGIGNTFEQVPGVASGSNPALYNASMFPLPGGALPSPFSIEPDFLSASDIIPGLALHRPEIRDVDMYRFDVAADGRVSIETFAQRLDETSLLDTEIKLWKLNPSTGVYDLVARNDDYYSNDSFIGIDVSPNSDGTPARYFVGITASGNDAYNPMIEGTGMGGRSQGAYQMRITFQNQNVDTIKDVNGTPLDGNGDGAPGGDFNFWFRTAKPKAVAGSGEARTLFVDKSGVNTSGSGDLLTPYRTIAYAFSQARAGDIVRILPSAGADGRIDTVGDNQAYEIGRGGPSNAILSDGETFNVPRGVTVMIDAGTIIKMRNAKISVGSSRIDDDRSLAALQVLGIPSSQVIFTSYHDESFGVDTNSLPTTPAPGQWAGIEFRNDFDYSEGRPVWETEGIFLDYVAHADIRYGGGSVSPSEPVVTPLQMLESRPTILHNTIQFSSDAAISADPNSFAETNFHAPIYQRVEAFTSDYDRVGPDIRGNRLVNNSINGLFVRVRTPAVGQREPMTVSGRFDDFDITHVISEVLVLQGQPGGPLLLEDRPDVLSVTYNVSPPALVGSLTVGQQVHYRITFVTRDGIESLASDPTATVTVGTNRNIRLNNLPQATPEYAGRRLYRFDPVANDYVFIRQLDRNSTTALDTGLTRGGSLSAAALATSSGERLMPRFDARLSIDPGLVIKMDTARIETGVGADFYAEGIDGKPVVFTSRLDDQYGAGGTFDTNNDGSAGVAQPGAWSGLVFRQGSSASLDHAVIRYAGGNSSVSGGFAAFNPIEILQADVRVANSVLSENAAGSVSDLDFRDGVGFNGPATIFVRGSQPVIVNNIIRDNLGAAISINPDSLDFQQVQDKGRGTGSIDRFEGRKDNQGALVAGNRLDGNGINGMLIRNEALTTESVWDDTDIVHVVERFVYAWNHHHRSGLRLKSDPGQSLVVKMQDGGAIVADRYLNDLENAIGGTIQVIGQPGFPVILTSIHDDTVGAGFTPSGLPQNDTDNAVIAASPGDWYGIVLRAGANDRNVAMVLENEPAIPESAGINAIPSNAQVIGMLATSETSSDENARLGFNVRGTLSRNSDLDVYSFFANGQTEVYIDIDDTHFGADFLVELVDVNGNILALSNSSFAEASNPGLLVNNLGPGAVLPLNKTGQRVIEGPNTHDPGMRVILPGNAASVNQYYVRVRSSNLAPGDPASKLVSASALHQGRSHGQYLLSVRLGEADEIAGSTIRLADIRYATHAIDVPASPFNSPLAAEFSERLLANGLNINPGTNNVSFASGAVTDLGNLLASHQGTLRVSGVLGNNVTSPQLTAAEEDLDVYRIEVRDTTTTPRITSVEPRFVSVSFDIDYADQLGGPNTRLSVYNAAGQLVAHGLNSNIADDQGRPRLGNDMTNLSAGSAGTLDASIGPVSLPEGVYFVVVSSAKMIPEPLAQLASSTAPSTGTRIIPNSSIRRIAEENFEDGFLFGTSSHVGGFNPYFGSPFADFKSSGDVPTVTPLFDDTSIVPYTLEDVRMFVTVQGGITGGNRTALLSVDPFTGQLERAIGQFGQSVGDLGIRRDGELFAYSIVNAGGAQNPGATGNYLNISAGNAAVLSSPDDSINFRRSNQDFNNTEVDPNAVLLVNAMSYQHPGSFAHSPYSTSFPGLSGSGTLTVVGNRSNRGRGGEVPVELQNNLVFGMMETNGLVTNTGNPNTNANRGFPANVRYIPSFGPASDRFEYGVLDVGQFVDSDPQKTGGNVTGLAQQLFSSQFYAVTSAGGVYRFTTFSVRQPIDPLTGLAQFPYSRVINSTFLGTVQRDPLHSPGSLTPPNFSSLTFGPQLTEDGRYRDVLFATTTDGWIYTLREGSSGAIEPAGVLVHGRSAIPILTRTGSLAAGSEGSFGQITGVAFSTREENPWHQSGRRSGGGEAHGTFPSVDQTQGRVTGGASLYFGFANGGIVNNDGGGGNQSPGGAHGSSVSTPFSLENYGSDDAPTLYFSYFLDVENNNESVNSPNTGPIANQAVDALRVFAVGDDGQWQLLATNNTFRGAGVIDEFDYFNQTGIPVQPLHDNTNTWRQARIDLSPLAGNKNVQLRFDFSTAGGMQSQFRTSGFLTEIQATPGVEVIPGSTFTLSRSLGSTLSDAVASAQPLTTFEFVRGVAINIPAGNAILDGQQISITGAAGVVNLIMTTVGTGNPNEVLFDRADSAETVAGKIQAVLLALDPTSTAVAVGSQLRDPEALAFSLTPERFGVLEIEMPANPLALDGQSLTLTNAIGATSTIRLESVQDVDFSVGLQSINVTAVNPGSADGVTIRFRDTLAIGDNPAFANFSNALRRITVSYNSAAATFANSDFNAIVDAIDALVGFTATLTGGVGTTPFTPPAIQPAFPTDEVYILPTDTAATIADKLAVHINALNQGFTANATAGQLTILGAGARILGASFNEIAFNQGGHASQLLPSGNVPIFYHWGMTAGEVRDAIRTALANGLGTRNAASGVTAASIENYPGFATNRIRVFEQSLQNNTSTLGFSTFLPGDEFGAFASSFVGGSQINPRPGMNNNIEGVFIDDIIIGFAERGELVTNAPSGNSNFVIDPQYARSTTAEYPNEILVGGYTLEIRQSVDYAVPNDFNSTRRPPNPRSTGGTVNQRNEQFGLGRAFDTNDRLEDAVTLIAPAASDIEDGDTFVISNGTRELTFEFDTNSSVTPGHVRVPFQKNLPDGRPFPAHDVATAIRDAINSTQSRNILGIVAAGIDGTQTGPSTATRINLFGSAVVINPSGGQFLKVDLVAAENRYGREAARTLPTVDQENRQATNDTIGSATDIGLANPVNTAYRNGATDTLIAVGKVGDAVYTDYTNSIFNESVFGFGGYRPVDDVDAVRIYLNAGDRIDAFAQIVGLNLGSILTPRVRIFDAETMTLQASSVDGVTGFLAPQSGFYVVAVSSAGGFGEYQLTIRPTIRPLQPNQTDAVVARYFLESGDANAFRAQGQLIIESNFISDFAETGIRATYSGDEIPGATAASTLERHPGGVALLRNPNTDRLVPGTVIVNNVITATQGNGIVYSGITPTDGSSPAPVPFGRLVNNTVVFPAQAQSVSPVDVEFLPINPATIMGPNDDGSSAVQNFGFDFRFFGNTYTQFYVNNNGNLTFANPLFAFTATGFPQNRPIIAPFWADVDTSLRPGGASAGTVHLTRGLSNRGNPVVQMDWVDVGYFPTFFPGNTGATNTFTVYIESHPQGDIVAFRYGDMAWTTGDASGGTNGFGGTGAQIGFDSGDGTNFISLGRPRSQEELDALLVDAPFIFQINPVTGIPGGSVSDGSGILVEGSVSPTILNNVISGFDVGLNVAANSNSTVENGNAFQRNRVSSNRPLASQSIEIPADVPLFEDITRRLYIPAAGSQIIDSSFANLNDRATFFNTVKQPVGISASPILAPTLDAYGSPRVDDPTVTTPGGIGGSVFIDRGGIDRSDQVQPTAVLVSPIDLISGQGVQVPGGDIDPDASFVRLPRDSNPLAFFEIQLLDPAGTGPDVTTITADTVILTENGVTLIPGVDYTFGYSDNSRLIRLTPLSGLWRPDAVYEITLNNKTRVGLTLPRGDAITDGDQYIVTDAQGRRSVLEFDSGYVMQVPQTLGIEVLGPNTFFDDGDIFTIQAFDGTFRTFEINLIGAVASGNIPINLASAGTVDQIRNTILTAINSVAGPLNLAPQAFGNDSLQIGSVLGHTVTGTVAGLNFFGVAQGVANGQQFRFQTETDNVLFEFSDGLGPVAPDAVAIEIARTDTIDEIASAISIAIQTELGTVTAAQSIGDGRVSISGSETDRLTIADSALTLLGRPGVTGPLELVVPPIATAETLDAMTFSVQNGLVTVNFEFTTDPQLVTPNRRVVLSDTDSPAQIAAIIAAEIDAAFTGALNPTATANVVRLGEQLAIIPPGTAQVLARIDVGGSLLQSRGVSGGAIPVPFIPTSQFAPALAAASFANALDISPLQVTTFMPGGGTLLLDNIVSIDLVDTAGNVTVAGQLRPAITDLAGNPVESNRDNAETRFTIIMPDVEFDFGDAPDSYGTTIAQNGARHSVGADALPRLGRVIDTEPDGQPFPLSDDRLTPVIASSPNSSPLFTFTPTPVDGVDIAISSDFSVVGPTSGDSIRIQIGDRMATFELVEAGVASLTGNIPVPLIPADDTPELIAQKLADAIRAELAPVGRSVVVTVDPAAPIIRIESLDDEDGVAIGQVIVQGQSYFVFLDPNADVNNATPSDVLGFLNPLDPAGTTVAVTVTGSGLLDAWVDFDGDGEFDPIREQILKNVPVVDGVNLLNVVTPANAAPGATWVRFRLSTSGNLRPTGSAVGGEVEDYQISIIPVAPFAPVDDFYEIDEDMTLKVFDSSPFDRLMDNDNIIIPSPFLPPRVIVVDQPANGTVTITDPLDGSFEYVPNPAFNGQDFFTYRLSSEGNAAASAPSAIIATVTINVLPVNDAPVFDFTSPIELLERDDQQTVTVSGVITGALPGRPEAIDEIASQTISISINAAASTIPAGLFQSMPIVVPTTDDNGVVIGGDLQFVQSVDAFGTALLVIDVVDDHPTDPQTTTVTITVNIRPVNDPPRLNPVVLGIADSQGPDNQYSVAAGPGAGTILYTSKEDQTLFIPLRRPTGVLGFNRIGLLDVFTVGPINETLPVDGGNQILELELGSFPGVTSAGGTLTPVFNSSSVLIGYNYQPPQDFNESFGGLDSFVYTVIDNNPLGGETWDLEVGGLVDGRLTASGLVQLRVNAVNDPPRFSMLTNTINVLEDSPQYRLPGFTFNIFAGPPTAFDENDPVTGQTVSFAVSGLTPTTSQMFASAPTVSPSGVLTFTPAPNAFGTVVLEVRATDDGPENAIRGDQVSSPAQTLTINIRPVNDRPVLNTTTPIVFTLNEDAAILQPDNTVVFQGTLIPLRGSGSVVGLLDVFDPGPPNESANVPGGNQTIQLATPIPASTAQGGTLTRLFDDPLNPTRLTGLRYTPRPNFNGTDSFIYGVRDNGMTSDLDGNLTPDPRESFHTVSLNVLPLNDPPQFSGPLSVAVDEDATTTAVVGETIIPNFVTDIAAGPPGALDELDPITGQTVTFVITPLAGNPSNLFAVPPTVSSDGTLMFRTVQDANGVAVFTIFAQDDGPHNPPLEFNRSTPPRTFTITVNPINDPPTFVADPAFSQITVPEDSGPFTTLVPLATQISPGPPDEVAAGQTVRFEVTVPAAGQSLFQTQPNVTDNGFFRFTPRDNAVGETVVSIVAIDSEGARSEPALVTITITEVNDTPIAGNVSFNGDENTVLPIPAQTLLDAAFDPDLETNPNEVLQLTAVATMSQSGAQIRVLPSGNLEYDPRGSATLQALRPGQNLADTFTYRVVDAAGAVSNLATVTVNVAGINDAPTVVDDFVTLGLNGPTTIRPLDNDFDVDGTINPLTLQITLLPAFGAVEVRNDGSLIYTPFANFRGTDTIRYRVADDLGAYSESATITIDTNIAPVATNDNASTVRGRAVDINVAQNDFDPDGSLDLNSIEIVTEPTRGTAIVLGGGMVRYLPNSDFVGIETFTYTIRDNRGRPSNIGQVRIQVVASELQNPSNFTDVDASGETSPIDALLILTRLSQWNQEGNTGSMPIEAAIGETPLRYYDVDGNRFIEPIDALAVIIEIARQNNLARGGEGEQVAASTPLSGPHLAAPPVTTMSKNTAALNGTDDFASVYGPVMAPAGIADLAADFTLPEDDIINTLAIDTAKEEAEKRRSELLEAIDAAWTDASQF